MPNDLPLLLRVKHKNAKNVAIVLLFIFMCMTHRENAYLCANFVLKSVTTKKRIQFSSVFLNKHTSEAK